MAAHDAGLCVVPPREDGTKSPLGRWRGYQKERPSLAKLREWYQGRRSGIGLVNGAVSGNLEALEFDDDDTYLAYKVAAAAVGLGSLVERIEHGYSERSPGGWHWLYRCEEITGNTKLARRPTREDERKHPEDNVKVLIETRGEGGYIIVAPTNGNVHETGKPYRLLDGGFATITTITPDERRSLFELARTFDQMPRPREEERPRGSKEAAGDRPGDEFNERASWPEVLEPHGWEQVYEAAGVTHWRRPGKDHGVSATTSFAGSDLLYVFSTSTPFDSERGYSKFSAYGVLNHGGDLAAAARDLASQGYGTPVAASAATDIHNTELGNARRLVEQHGADLRYCSALGWLAYDGTRWRRDDTGEVERRAKQTVMNLYREAADEPDEERRKALVAHARRSETNKQLTAMINIAKSEPGIPVRVDELDRDPWALNVLNGTLDLRDGSLRPHRRDDLITKLAPVAYDSAATCPLWLSFLNRIMGGNRELIGFLQRMFGLCLTAVISEQVLFMLYGTGANGKSTTVNTILAVLGDYGRMAAPGLLLKKRHEGHPTERADLYGARLVASVEVDRGRALAEALVKEMTGGERMKGRFMFRDFFEWTPTHKLILCCNHRPTIRGTDNAIWRRVRLVPFTVTIPEDERDNDLGDKLQAEAAGILRWAIDGCLAWQRDGLGAPDEVVSATEAYRAQMDVLGVFLCERTYQGPNATCTVKELYDAYKGWCDTNGERAETKNDLNNLLAERGFIPRRTGSRGRFWQGLGILTESEG